MSDLTDPAAVAAANEQRDRETREHVRAGALAAAKRLLPRRPKDAQAFADLVLARFDAIARAFHEFGLFDPEQAGEPEYRAAQNKLMVTAQSSVSLVAVEALRLSLKGSERGRTQ